MPITQGVLVPSPELEAHDEVLRIIQIKLEFGNVVFEEREKLEYP